MIIRSGTYQDIIWITKLLIEGANDGHYLSTVKDQAKELLQNIVANGGVQVMKLRGSIQAPVFLRMNLTIAEIDGNPVSFLVCSIEPNEVEIYLAGTLKKSRRHGCFNNLVTEAVSTYSNNRIYARCYKKSSWAIKGLESLNFKITKSGNPIELALIEAE